MKREKDCMKKKVYIFFIILLMVFVFIFGRGIYFYVRYIVPDKNYFGDQYKEILYPMSFRDNKQASMLMIKVDDAFSFIGNKADADNIYGELSRYCITEEDAITEEHTLQLVTANFDKDKGYMWFVYNQKSFDRSNKSTGGSQDILVRLNLMKTDQGWIFVDAKEHP